MVRRFDEEYPDIDLQRMRIADVSDKLVNLLADATFIPIFGTSYETLDKSDRKALEQKLVRACGRHKTLRRAYRQSSAQVLLKIALSVRGQQALLIKSPHRAY